MTTIGVPSVAAHPSRVRSEVLHQESSHAVVHAQVGRAPFCVRVVVLNDPRA